MKKILVLFQAFGKNGLFAKVPHLIRMVKTAKKGDYKMDFKSVLIPSLAIIYILSPLDIIPDWIPVVGALDDFGILALTIPFVLKELDKFIAWEQEQKNRTNNITDAEIIQ
jgi:uncharacterized membrane protein YkvA (DUF1232 family)